MAKDKKKKEKNPNSKGRKVLHFIICIIGIAIGAFLYAAGTSLFLDPNMLAPGGVIGIAVILSRFIPLSTGLIFFILNIPLFIFGIIKFGIKFMAGTVYAVALSSIFTQILGKLPPVTDDLFIAAFAGAVLMGAGIGIVFLSGATTGGSDIIVKALRQKHPNLRTGTLFFLTDLVVVTASGITTQDFKIAIYALIAVMVSGFTMDFILYGRDEAHVLYIISDKYIDITKRLMDELDVGATLIEAEGAYTGQSKKVIMCAVKKSVGPRVEQVVKEEDPQAFFIVSNAKEIYGEGYKDILKDKV